MSSVFSISSVVPSLNLNHSKLCKSKCKTSPNPNDAFTHCKISQQIPLITKSIRTISRNKPHTTLKFTARYDFESFDEENTINFDWDDLGDIEDTGSPWEGAIIYKRNSSISHVEYCTTLERLGLEKLSTEVSKSRASAMGLRVTKAVKDYPKGTPVHISIDITRKKRKLRLDGLLRTVIALGCNRCGEPAAECIYSNFSLLLTEEPIEESDVINMGVIFREDDKLKTSIECSEEDDEASIDLDDRLYFPPEETEIDISKNIRDMVHVEITINAVCDPKCKGLCLKCGINLNTDSCKCSKEEVKVKGYGPLEVLKKQIQQK